MAISLADICYWADKYERRPWPVSSLGTALGLSISHDIVVKQHTGSIEIDTQLGEFTEVKIILPRMAASIA